MRHAAVTTALGLMDNLILLLSSISVREAEHSGFNGILLIILSHYFATTADELGAGHDNAAEPRMSFLAQCRRLRGSGETRKDTLAQAEVKRGGGARGVDGDDPPDHRGRGARRHAHPDDPGRGGGGAHERRPRRAGQHGLPEQLRGELPELGPGELRLALEPRGAERGVDAGAGRRRGHPAPDQRDGRAERRVEARRGVGQLVEADAPEGALRVGEAPFEGVVAGGGERRRAPQRRVHALGGAQAHLRWIGGARGAEDWTGWMMADVNDELGAWASRE